MTDMRVHICRENAMRSVERKAHLTKLIIFQVGSTSINLRDWSYELGQFGHLVVESFQLSGQMESVAAESLS